MNWDAVSAIAEVLGLIAVVVSLVYLASQVKQNTQQLRQENLRVLIRGTLDTNWYYHRDPEAFRIFKQGVGDFDHLPAREQAHFHSLLIDLAFYVQIVRQLVAAKLIDSSALEVNMRFLLAVLLTPGGRQWWAMVQRTRPMPQSSIDMLQAELDAVDADQHPKITDLQPWFGADNT